MRRKAIQEIVSLGLVVSVCSSAGATVRYVNGAVSSSGNGLSWATAKKTIQEAINDAQGSPGFDQVWVAAGVYTPGSSRSDSVMLKSDVAVFGGFDGTESALEEREPSINVTTISGEIQADSDATNNSYSVVDANAAAGLARLDGFTIRDGFGPNNGTGAGINCPTGSAPVIANCIIQNNAIPGYSS